MLILLCGLPRAGKTTYSKRYNCRIIHYDRIGYTKTREIIDQIDEDVVVDGIYNSFIERKKLCETYKGAGTKCIWLNTPLEIRKTRPLWHPSTEFPFESPTLEEGWDEIVIINNENDIQYIKRE